MNIAHLDIKPQNIFVGLAKNNKYMGIVYMDLGTAIVLDSDEDTPKYITSLAT